MTRIAIFDDSPRILHSLQLFLELTPNFEVTGAFDNATNLVEKLYQSTPDVILMDIDMPGINGIDAISEVRNILPDTVIIMQTIFDDEERIFKCLRQGAHGYLTKDTPPLKMIEAIEEAQQGGSPMTPGIARKVIGFFKQNEPKPAFNLSPRETEILQNLSNGLSYKLIATHLCIAYETVHSHIRKIYQKLQVNSLGEAIALAFRNKIIE